VNTAQRTVELREGDMVVVKEAEWPAQVVSNTSADSDATTGVEHKNGEGQPVGVTLAICSNAGPRP
jgi:hypothetical protein